MPQHFIVKCRAPEAEFFLDPFNDGRILTRQHCIRFLKKNNIAFNESFLREATDREILSRMLGNLLWVYHSSQDQKRLNRVLGMLRLLERAFRCPGGDESFLEDPRELIQLRATHLPERISHGQPGGV